MGGLRLEKNKVFLEGAEEMKCVHKITEEGVRLLKANLRAIREASRLQNTSQLKSCLGRINHYYNFQPRFSTVSFEKNCIWSSE